MPTSQIAYVDETGIDTYLYREHGWAERGERIIGYVSGHKFRRTGIVAAKLGKRILAPLQYDGTMDSVLFETWFEQCLIPALPKYSVIVMDNPSFHRKNKLLALSRASAFRLVFLPPYSPELNPIENFWGWLKRNLRKTLSNHPSFDDALRSAFHVC